ncbi:MAG: PHB depolymerase family esterase [bacterium]
MDKRNFIWLLIVFSMVTGAVIFCTGIPRIELTERDIEINLEHDGYSRDFILHIPKHHENLNKIPLLIALHGGGGTAKGMIRLTKSRFNELVDKHGFLVVYPQGLGKSWNDGRQDPISYAHENDIDDIGFLSKIIQSMEQEFRADPGRVFVTGISNGGFMSIRVSRELADQVKAVTPVCAGIPLVTKGAHMNGSPINILLVNGTTDPLVPYNGGEVEVLGKKRGKIISTDETIRIFVTRNGCSDVSEIEELEDRDPKDGTRVIREEYVNTETGNKVVLLKVVDGGHTWPGGWQYLNEKWIGRTSLDINACDEIWSFFSSLR